MKKKYLVTLIYIALTTNACGPHKMDIKKEYYSNGMIKREFCVINDSIKDGTIKEFYQNGKLKFEGKCKKNVYDGIYKLYYENGKVKEEGSIVMGQHNGEEKEFEENGNLSVVSHWKNNLQTGPIIYYYEQKINKIEYYSQGVLDSGIQFDSVGNFANKIWPITFESKSDTIKLGTNYIAHISLKGIVKFTKGIINVFIVDSSIAKTDPQLTLPTYHDKFENNYFIVKRFDKPGAYIVDVTIQFEETGSIHNVSYLRRYVTVKR